MGVCVLVEMQNTILYSLPYRSPFSPYNPPTPLTPHTLAPLSDPQNAFQRTMVNGILVREGEDCTVPCLATDPAVTLLALNTCDGRLLPSDLRYRADPQRGIIIAKAKKVYEGCYMCVGELGGVLVNSSQYTVDVRLGK